MRRDVVNGVVCVQADLIYEEVYGGVKVLSSLAEINMAITSGEEERLLTALNDSDAHIDEVELEYIDTYMKGLQLAREKKQEVSAS